jgi:hypothetical protein
MSAGCNQKTVIETIDKVTHPVQDSFLLNCRSLGTFVDWIEVQSNIS